MIAQTINVPISSIQFDSATQLRAEINSDTVAEYAEAMAGGSSFPPVVLFGADHKYWIGDGWHRLLAAQHNGDVTVPAVVHVGGRANALKYALSANARHGLKRTNADKQKAVAVALREFPQLSDRAIAELCAVSHPTVASVRGQVVKFTTSDANERQGQDGKSYPVAPTPPQPTITAEDLAAATGTTAGAETKVEVVRAPLLKPSGGTTLVPGWQAQTAEMLKTQVSRVPAQRRREAVEFMIGVLQSMLEDAA